MSHKFWTIARLDRFKAMLGEHDSVTVAIRAASAEFQRNFSQSMLRTAFYDRFGDRCSAYLRAPEYSGPSSTDANPAPYAKRPGPAEVNRILAALAADTARARDLVGGKGHPRPKTPHSGAESVVCVLADWHLGHDDETGRRIAEIPQRVEEMLEGRDVGEIVCVFCGDLVDGEAMFPGHGLTLRDNVSQQSDEAAQLAFGIMDCLNRRAPAWGCGVMGNHGKCKDKSPHANFDRIALDKIRLLCCANGLAFDAPCGEAMVALIRNYRVLIRHKGPAQAETAAARARLGSWVAKHDVDAMIFAHHHHWGVDTFTGIPIFHSGRVYDSGDFAERIGVGPDVPTQIVFSLTDDCCPAWVAPISWED